MSFKFGLNVKNKGANPLAKASAKVVPGKKKPLLGDEDDIVDKAKTDNNAQEIGEFSFDSAATSLSTPSKPAPSKPKKGQPLAPPDKKAKAKEDDPTTTTYSASALEAETRAQEAIAADATLYDYDAAYEALHAGRTAAAALARDDATNRKPKYMDALFESAEQRKKDQLRARDKLLQREREAEGDEFADKEKFVTGAYKAQQEEARKAEAEEAARQAEEEEKKRKYGMQGFHKQMLAEQERRHQEAMDAAAKALKDGSLSTRTGDTATNDAPSSGPLDFDKLDLERAAQLRAQGKHIILTDDGLVADNRQLLSAGLNIIAKPKLPGTHPSHPPTSSTPQPHSPSAPPKPATHRLAQRDRQTAMILAQIEASNKRKADEDAAQQAKLQQRSKSQKTDSDISSARERYLARKRDKEMAAQTTTKTKTT
ncbi:hypothetical protein ACN47E_006741 [Coniothyrium glycines]